MDDLPHPLDGTADHLGNDAIALLTDGEQDDAGIATVHGIAPQPLQAAKFDRVVRTKRAYSNNVFHGDTSWDESHNTPLEVSYSNVLFAAAHKSTYTNDLRRESCQLKTAVHHLGPHAFGKETWERKVARRPS